MNQKKHKSKIHKSISMFIIIALLFSLNFGFVNAEEAVGPQGEIGPTGQLGSDGNVGPTEPVGTQEGLSEIKELNTTDTGNQVDQGLISGQNTSNTNTGDGSVSSGDTNTAAGIVNSNESNFSPDSLNGGIINTEGTGSNLDLNNLSNIFNGNVSNSDTGSNSTNDATLDILNNVLFNSTNKTDINNNMPINIDTGNNQASYNTGNGTINSGDTNVALTFLNVVDTIFSGEVTFGILSIFGDYLGDIIVPNSSSGGSDYGGIFFVIDALNKDTGENSNNSATNDITNGTTVLNNNQADISNNVPINVNTGGNEADNNTGNGSTDSGDINIKTNLASIIGATFSGDSWYLVFVNVFGDWFGNLFGSKEKTSLVGGSYEEVSNKNQPVEISSGASNENTGQNSDNKAESNLENNLTLQNENNTKISNEVPINVNTGQNQANGNTGNSTVNSGDINILTSFINLVSSKISANNIYLLFINIFGNWDGSIREQEQEMSVIPINDFVPLDIKTNTNSEGFDLETGFIKSTNDSGEKIGNSELLTKEILKNLEINEPSLNNEDGEGQTIVLDKKSGNSDDFNNSDKGFGNLQEILKALMILSMVIGLAGINYQRKLKLQNNKTIKGKGVRR